MTDVARDAERVRGRGSVAFVSSETPLAGSSSDADTTAAESRRMAASSSSIGVASPVLAVNRGSLGKLMGDEGNAPRSGRRSLANGLSRRGSSRHGSMFAKSAEYLDLETSLLGVPISSSCKDACYDSESGDSGDGEAGSSSSPFTPSSHMTQRERVAKLQESSATQRFNIFHERRRGMAGGGDPQKLEAQHERLNASILASRKAMKKVSRVFAGARKVCTDLFASAVARRAGTEERIKIHIDEYIKICLNRSGKPDTHDLHHRFCAAVDEMRTLRFDLQGVLEHGREVSDRCGGIIGELYARLCVLSGAILREDAPEELVACSSRSFVDTKFGLVIQQWEDHEAVKQFGKAIERFLNYPQCAFHTPCFVAIECCGRPFTAMTIAPLFKVVHSPLNDPWLRFYVMTATCETQLKPDEAAIVRRCRFAFGADGRLYCLRADGLIPSAFPDTLLCEHEGPATKEALAAAMTRNVENVCTELTAISRANACEVSKVLHKHGTTMQQIHYVHAYLSEAEQAHEQVSANAAEDQNVIDVMRAVVAELLARTLKVIIREQWRSILPGEDHVMAREMGSVASQLVFSLIIEGLQEGEHLYTTIAALSRKLFPVPPKAKVFAWEEFFVSEEHVALRVARFLGLHATSGVLAMTAPHRFVRGTNLRLHPRLIAIVRGKHREALQKLVSRIKSSRSHSPHYTPLLTYALGDVFHQATARSGVTNSPQQLYAQMLSTSRSSSSAKRRAAAAAAANSSNDGNGGSSAMSNYVVHDDNDDDDDDDELCIDEYEVVRLLAHQATFLFAAKRITQRELVAAFSRFLELSIKLSKGAAPSLLFPFHIASRVRLLHHVAKVFSEPVVLTQMESVLQMLDNNLRRASKETMSLDARHANWMWRLLFNGLASGKARRDPDGSVAVVRRKLEQAAATFGEASVQAIGCLADVATQLADLGRLDEAVVEYERTQKALGAVDPLNRVAFTTATNLGVAYYMMASSRCPEALKKRRSTLLRVVFPEEVTVLLAKAAEQFAFVIKNREHADLKQIADTLNNLGSANMFAMRYGEALTCFEDSLALTREHFSDDHPDRAAALRNAKQCERMMRHKAAILIGCWMRRARARAQLVLLKKGALYVRLFQAAGRGMLVRLQLHRHGEKRRIKLLQQQRIAAAAAASASAASATTAAGPLVPRVGGGGGGTWSGSGTLGDTASSLTSQGRAASPLWDPTLSVTARRELVAAVASDSAEASIIETSAISIAPLPPSPRSAKEHQQRQRQQEEEQHATPETTAAAATLLQSVGRGFASRQMLAELVAARNCRREKAKVDHA